MKTFLTAALLLALVACKEVSFKQPQPRGKKSLHAIPAVLQGTYLLSDSTGSSKDTLLVSATGYRTVSDKRETILGDSVVLKAYKGYYFLSINENPEWLLRVVKPQPNGDLLYLSMDVEEKKFNKLLRDLSREVTIDSIQLSNEKLYQIDPSPQQLMKLIKKGYFKRSVVMKRMK